MEARLAKLESDVQHIHTDVSDIKATLRQIDGKLDGARDRADRDFRIGFGAVIAVALGLAGVMAKGFHWF